MKCSLCKREAKYLPSTQKGIKRSEMFSSIRWNKVDENEYKQRKSDGRALLITEVCPECIAKYNDGRPPLGLHDLNEIRKRGITKEEYYKEHGY